MPANYVEIRNNPNEYFNNEDNRSELKDMDDNERKAFVTQLVGGASPVELDAIAKSANQALGGFELDGVRDMVSHAVMGRKQLDWAGESVGAGAYLAGKSEINDAAFNPGLYHQFPELFATSLNQEAQVGFLFHALMTCGNAADISALARGVQQAFPSEASETMQELIALNQQNLATSDNPHEILLSDEFNPGLSHQYEALFVAQLNGKIDAVADKIASANLSIQERAKIFSRLEDMNPNACTDNVVSQLRDALNKKFAAKDNSVVNQSVFAPSPVVVVQQDDDKKKCCILL